MYRFDFIVYYLFFLAVNVSRPDLLELESFKIVYLIAALFSVISFPFIPLNGIIVSYEKFIQLNRVI